MLTARSDPDRAELLIGRELLIGQDTNGWMLARQLVVHEIGRGRVERSTSETTRT